MRWILFPKCYQGYSTAQVADLLQEVGLDAVSAMIRPGYWVDPGNLESSLRAFVNEMASFGVPIHGASTDFLPRDLLEGDQLQILADQGIQAFRMGWYQTGEDGSARALEQARRELTQLEARCERIGIRAVYQVHHGTLVSSPTAAYMLVRDLNPEFIGVKLDPGNQSFEGMENWDYACDLLDGYVRSIGVKDSMPIRQADKMSQPDKGWSQVFCGLDEGTVNWQKVMQPLLSRGFDGWLVFMPFYHCEPEKVFERTIQLKRDVEVLKQTILGLKSG